MPRRITCAVLDDVDDGGDLLTADGHAYFRRFAPPPLEYMRVDMRPRALFVFLCPAEAPTPADLPYLRRLIQANGVGEVGVAFLFTDPAAKAEDLPDLPGAVGPLADNALRAALRWVERPGRGRLQSGLVILCHGLRWKRGSIRGHAMDERLRFLWQSLRAFKRHPVVCGEEPVPVNPLLAKRPLHPGLCRQVPPADGGPRPGTSCTSWWTLPRS